MNIVPLDIVSTRGGKPWEKPVRPKMRALYETPQTPFVKSGPDIGRNDPCPCGSGKKYKKCHLK